MDKPLQYGLIGFPLEHSFSPQYFGEKFRREDINAEYHAYPLSNINELNGLLSSDIDLRGLNVTIPYKSEVMQLLDEINPDAQAIGAVNCINIIDGKTLGYNTDIIGFTKSLTPMLQSQHTEALILGSGGSSKAVAFALNKLNIQYKIVSRRKGDGVIHYSELTEDIISSHKLIINTTPLGMYPDTGSFPALPYDAIGTQHLLFDLVYNPLKTMFLQLGEQCGASVKNGFEMLELQAEASWHIWNSG